MPIINAMSNSSITAYADGGCSGNPGPGAWAYVILADEQKKSVSGFEQMTTNNKMELTAVIRALEFIGSQNTWKNENVVLFTDSRYVQKGISDWIQKWIANGWKTSNRKPVKNRELWIHLKDLCNGMQIEWKWIKGHSGDKFNEECDSMVRKEMNR